MNIRPYIMAIVLSLASFSIFAADENHDEILAGIKQLVPDLQVDSIKKSPIDGLYQVMLGTDILYVTEDGRFIVSGEIYDTDIRKNVSEAEKSKIRAVELEKLSPDELIEFAPEKGESLHTLYVFTDISCGYCRKLHQDIPQLNDMGFTIKYLAYPRAGVQSNAGYELAAVWCADDRNKAMNDAKTGAAVSNIKECDDPVESHYKLGNKIGVNGTPAIFLENGLKLPGYYPPLKLLEIVSNS